MRLAFFTRRSTAWRRASSRSCVYSVISPPTIERSPAMMLPPSPRLRTTTPNTCPLTSRTRYPGTFSVVTTSMNTPFRQSAVSILSRGRWLLSSRGSAHPQNSQCYGARELHGGRRPGPGQILLQILRSLGAREKEALRLITAILPQQLGCGLGLDALRHDGHAEAMCELDRAAHDALIGFVGIEVDHEAPVDLECRDRQAFEIRERCVAGAEIIDGKLDPELADRMQPPQDRFGVAHDGALCDLELQQVRRHGGGLQRLAELLHEGMIQQIVGADVDRHRDVVSHLPPASDLFHRALQYELCQGMDQLGARSEVDVLGRRHRPDRRMSPAR